MKNFFVLRGVDGIFYPEANITGVDGKWVNHRATASNYWLPIVFLDGRVGRVEMEPTGEFETSETGEVAEVLRPLQT
jgi:hypothetical protein